MPLKQISLDLLGRAGLLLRQARTLLRGLALRPPSSRLEMAAHSLRWMSWRLVAGAVLAGGIVHIGATFAAPLLGTGHAYQLLSDKLPLNRMVVLPQQAPGRQILPYLPPDMLYAMCRYDLRKGPLAVTAPVLGPGWALSLHTPQGTNFYVLPGQALRRTDVSFLVVPSGPDAAPVSRREGGIENQIASPTAEGLVVLRGTLRGIAWSAEIEAAMQRATCTPLKR
jgi:uncharacterized membrane protein